MGCAVTASAAVRRADDEGTIQTVNGFQLGGHVGELVDRKGDEIHEHKFNNRTLTRDCCADGYAGERLFRDGCVANTRWSEGL